MFEIVSASALSAAHDGGVACLIGYGAGLVQFQQIVELNKGQDTYYKQP